MGAIKSLHHVALKAPAGEYPKVVAFYRDVLELPVIRVASNCTMLDFGNTILEIIEQEDISCERCGCLDHFAMCVEPADVDRLIARLSEAGYEVTMQPTDIVIDSTPAYPARIAFFTGPYGESVELFAER